MKCNQCGSEFEGKFCAECGAKASEEFQKPVTEQSNKKKNKKPFYRRWWFILLVVVAVVAVAISVLGMGEKVSWNNIVLGEMLPEPPKDRGNLHTNSSDELWVEINNVSDKEYNSYVEACKGEGYTIDAESTSSNYTAYNKDGYKLSLSFYGEELDINLDKPIELSEITWPSGIAGIQLPVPNSMIGKFSYEYDDNF